MSDVAIRAEALGKRYRIGELQAYKALRDTLTDALYAPFRAVASVFNGARRSDVSASDHFIWALKEVSFEIQRGEAVGVIGRNGAGKSTLLRILSRITEPTEGFARIRGRVGSLLEVGTGFHPELTGRENIYLNGAILGMRKAEIDRKFDEIVAFAEVERFIDTPVKYYSTGMFVRLSFAVAAHLEPEILLVDEVLAVGDAAFQKKCLGKMGGVLARGRTVVFVSHNMGAIRSLTQSCLYLKDGEIESYGFTVDVVQRYLADLLGSTGVQAQEVDLYRRDPGKGSPVRFKRIWVNDSEKDVFDVEMEQDFTIFMELESSVEVRGAHLGLGIKRKDGTQVLLMLSIDHDFRLFVNPGTHIIACTIRKLPLTPGDYLVDVGINQSEGSASWDVILDYPLFRVTDRAAKVIHWADRPWGAVHWNQVTWSLKN